MNVGAVTNTVQVTSEAPQLQSDTTQVSTLIDANTIIGIPLATRNYVELTLLAPGSITPDNSTFNNGDNTASGGRPSINGNREQSDNFILDGMDNNQTSENLSGLSRLRLMRSRSSTSSPRTLPPSSATSRAVSSTLPSSPAPISFMVTYGSSSATTCSMPTNGRTSSTVRAIFCPVQALRWNMFGGTLGGPSGRTSCSSLSITRDSV